MYVFSVVAQYKAWLILIVKMLFLDTSVKMFSKCIFSRSTIFSAVKPDKNALYSDIYSRLTLRSIYIYTWRAVFFHNKFAVVYVVERLKRAQPYWILFPVYIHWRYKLGFMSVFTSLSVVVSFYIAKSMIRPVALQL